MPCTVLGGGVKGDRVRGAPAVGELTVWRDRSEGARAWVRLPGLAESEPGPLSSGVTLALASLSLSSQQQ